MMNDTEDQKKPQDDIPDTLSIELKKPITLGDDTTFSLELREPMMGEIERFVRWTEKNDAVTSMNMFIALIANKSKAVIDKVPAREGKQAREYLSSFL